MPRPDGLVPGVDASRWQGRVDWPQAAASGLCEFAMVKASEGERIVDDRFAENWAGALYAGVPRGAYHFMTAGPSPQEQAAHFLRTYPGGGELPPALDLERGADGREPPADAALAWVRTVMAELGVRPIVYCSPDYARRLLANPAGFELGATCELWVAHFGVKAPTVPAPWGRWRIWQTGAGDVPGFRGKVDLNLMRKIT